MKFIVRTWLEIEFLIKRSCLPVDGVNQNRPNAKNIRGALDPKQSVFKQRPAQAPPLFLPVYRQSPEQSYGYRMPRQPLSGSRRSAFSGDAARSNGIVAHDDIRAVHYIRPGAVVRLVLQGVLSQPQIQRLMPATIKGSQIMGSVQGLNLRELGHSIAFPVRSVG